MKTLSIDTNPTKVILQNYWTSKWIGLVPVGKKTSTRCMSYQDKQDILPRYLADVQNMS